MSEFDKEAERERLREKYGDDEERESTQRMSQLLLQGATMTNRHCDNCGDPIFRQNGQEFCPTCQGQGRGQATAESGDAPDARDAAASDVQPSASAPDAPADESASAAREQADAAADSPSGVDDATGTGTDAPTAPSRAAASGSERDVTTERGESSLAPQAHAAGATGGLEAAETALTTALTRFARAAADSDDPRRAQDHLAAAREAAEALAALRN